MKNLSLNKKIIALLSIFVTASLIISFVGISKVITINDSVDNLINKTNKKVMLAKDMDVLISQMNGEEKSIIIEEELNEMKSHTATLDGLEKEIRSKIDEFELLATPAAKQNLLDLEKILDNWKEVSIQLRELSYVAKDKEAKALSTGKSKEYLGAFENILDEMVKRNEGFMQNDANEMSNLVANTKSIITLVSVVSLLIGAVVAFYMLRMINKAIEQVITNLNDSTSLVSSSASQIASSSQELSQATTEQASSLEETAASIEEMSSMISRNSDSANISSENSRLTQANAIKGKETIREMISSIDEINESNNKIKDQINYSNSQLADIVKVISEIGNKTKVINDIVFQTKLLSFNASVEAARAGEHGKGFAVVAEEVGNLAAMSGNAAKEITTMLDESIHKVESIVNETKTSVEKLINEGRSKVEKGTYVAQNCEAVFEEIVTNINKVNNLSVEISTACSEQAQGITEITKAMHQLDQVTQQNASATEQTSSAAEELSAQAVSLKATVAILVATIKGGGHTETTTTTKVVKKQMHTAPKNNVVPLPVNKKSEKSAAVVVTKKTNESSSDKAPSYDDVRFKDV
jgi:methyl-accepting chemotaxis protein